MTELTDFRIQDAPQGTTNVAPIRQRSTYWIESASGKRIDLVNPDPAQIMIEDIAWSLSRLPRFLGHTRDLQPVSVASHSLWVGLYVWEETRDPLAALQALLHDAHEAFIGDIPTPVKSLPIIAPQITVLELRLQRAINLALSVPAPDNDTALLIKTADAQALAMEARNHTMNRGEGWGLLAIDKTAEAVGRIEPKRPVMTFEAFMTSYHIFQTRIDGVH